MNYYNEHDPKAAAWLRELIKSGLISNGIVDERSIQNVKPNELTEYKQCHFFAGIGGWSLALRIAGIPDDHQVWTGSCPCQPFSIAGKGLQEADERHLWPDFRNLIGECSPTIVFGEQVASADGRKWLHGVSTDLETLAYRFAAADLCAASVGSPHIRQRLYWTALRMEQSDGFRREQRGAESIRGSVVSRCGPRGMAQSNGTGWDSGKQAAMSPRHGNSIITTSDDGGLANSESKREGSIKEGSRQGIFQPDRSCRVANPKCDEEQQKQQEPEMPKGGWGSDEFSRRCMACWENFDILDFRDGKQRRVEAGTFPLAHGIPNRVGLLRGYGNAIVPQVAAEFIKAALK